MAANSSFTIGGLARRAKSSVRTIRYYESIGLLAPADRSAGNQRVYDGRALARLEMIRRWRELGFPLAQVRELLALSDTRVKTCGDTRRIAAERRDEVRAKLAALEAIEAVLSARITECDAVCGAGLKPPLTLLERLLQHA